MLDLSKRTIIYNLNAFPNCNPHAVSLVVSEFKRTLLLVGCGPNGRIRASNLVEDGMGRDVRTNSFAFQRTRSEHCCKYQTREICRE